MTTRRVRWVHLGDDRPGGAPSELGHATYVDEPGDHTRFEPVVFVGAAPESWTGTPWARHRGVSMRAADTPWPRVDAMWDVVVVTRRIT